MNVDDLYTLYLDARDRMSPDDVTGITADMLRHLSYEQRIDFAAAVLEVTDLLAPLDVMAQQCLYLVVGMFDSVADAA